MAEEELLTTLDTYLAAGVHIGTQQRDASMKDFIYNIRPDGLSVFNLQQINSRVKAAAKLIVQYPKESVLAVSGRESGKKAIAKFSEATGCTAVLVRFMPGSLTNPRYKGYTEPKLLLSTDPNLDLNAIREAMLNGVPIIGFCDTNTRTSNLDLVIPGNNKGRKSMALLWYLLSREVLRERGDLDKDSEAPFEVDDFLSVQSEETKKRIDSDKKKRFGKGSFRGKR